MGNESISTYHLTDRGIVIANFRQELQVDINLAKQIVSERLAFQNGEKYPVIIYLNKINPSKEARSFMGNEGIKDITIGAFIVKNAIEKVLINFFLSIEKPPIPAKAFTNEEDAISWINKIREHE